MNNRLIISLLIALAIMVFFAWRFMRPMNIFTVSEAFESAIPTDKKPDILNSFSAKECANCHQEFYDEWRTTIHSQAWSDPYFQVDWKYEGSQHICRNCHTPLDKQQPQTVIGFKDQDKWDPILKANPQFDKALQHEGVTCNACHLREGKIVGIIGNTNAPHPVKKLDNPNQICVRCHVVEGDRWDTFFRFPPCGTVAEIQTSSTVKNNKSGELAVLDVATLGCVECHMPAIERPLVTGGKVRTVRQHLWRGGHDPEMVSSALSIKFTENKSSNKNNNVRQFTLTLENTGAAHYLPTGTPDRHLTIEINLLDSNDVILKQKTQKLIRTVLWRPFIIDLWDTRLKRYRPRKYLFEYDPDDYQRASSIEVITRYHLLDEKRRKHISYENNNPIAYEIYRKKYPLYREKPIN